MRAGGQVHQESGDGADHGDEAGERVVLPGVPGGHLAVGEGGEGVGEDVDEGSGEDDAGGEALDYESGAVVGGLALEVAGEEDRGGDAHDAGDEDDGDGYELELRGRVAVAASERSGRVGNARGH